MHKHVMIPYFVLINKSIVLSLTIFQQHMHIKIFSDSECKMCIIIEKGCQGLFKIHKTIFCTLNRIILAGILKAYSMKFILNVHY